MVQRDPSSLTAAPHYGGILLPAAIPPALSSYPKVEIERLPRRWRLERKTRASNSSDCGFSPFSRETSTSRNAAFARVWARAWHVREERTIAFDNHRGRV